VSQANFRIAPLARPDLVERQPELLAHHLTAAGDIVLDPDSGRGQHRCDRHPGLGDDVEIGLRCRIGVVDQIDAGRTLW
jgi:hypothetical protein